jgi:hypothetical protein
MDLLINRLKGLLWNKTVIEGYILSEDIDKKLSLVLVKDSDKSWRTKWLNNSEYEIKLPKQSISQVFLPNNK